MDIAKAIKQERYNSIYNNLTKGTISDKQSIAELGVQEEEITRIIYARAYAIVKNKMEYATELLASIKKVITRRTAEYQMTDITDDRFKS